MTRPSKDDKAFYALTGRISTKVDKKAEKKAEKKKKKLRRDQNPRGQLTEMQQRFVEEYLCQPNPKLAAIRAGYSAKTAYQTGRNTLLLPKVQARLKEIYEQHVDKGLEKRARVIQELERIAFGDITTSVDIVGGSIVIRDDLDGRVVHEISESKKMGTKIKHFDKLKALELLGKYLSLWEEDIKKEDAPPPKLEISFGVATPEEMDEIQAGHAIDESEVETAEREALNCTEPGDADAELYV